MSIYRNKKSDRGGKPLGEDSTALLPESQIRSIFQRTSVGLAAVDGQVLVDANSAFQKLSEAAGQSPSDLAKRAVSGERIEIAGRSCSVRVEASTEPTLIEIIPLERSATDRVRPDERDALTGVLTRRALDERLNAWFEQRSERPFALGFLDLDGFKPVNDRHGHLIGDACLREAGGRLQGVLRDADLVGRFGGDEFVLLLFGVSDERAFAPVADRVTRSLIEPIPTEAGPMAIGCSLGVAFATAGSASVSEVLASADRAMYAQKALLKPAEEPADVADSARLG